MTETTLIKIIRRALSDGAFRAELQRDANKALAGSGLTASELAAVASWDPKRLTALGVDQRMSKAFTAGGLGNVSKSIDSDMTGAYPTAKTFIDEGGIDGRVIPGDPLLERATLVQSGRSANETHLRIVEQDLNVAGSATVAASVTSVPVTGGLTNLRRIEQDLDVTQGTDLDLPQPGPDPSITEY